jgi:TetR/AcrR family transcriptional repressor of nem operon
MADAGLTHGAFYSHFDSKADLAAFAFEHASDQKLDFFRRKIASVPSGKELEAFITLYLHTCHRDNMATGCAMSALLPEMARENATIRKRVAKKDAAHMDMIAELLPPGGTEQARRNRASSVFALILGTLQLTRVETDSENSDRMIEVGREAALQLARIPW